MLSALYAIAHPSVCLSVRHTVDRSKTVEVRIMKISPHSSPIALVFADKFNPKFLMGSPERGSNKGGVGKQAIF